MSEDTKVDPLILGKVEFNNLLNKFSNYTLPQPDFTLEHVTLTDYNRYGMIAFSGVTGLLANLEFQERLAWSRRKMTITITFED